MVTEYGVICKGLYFMESMYKGLFADHSTVHKLNIPNLKATAFLKT